MAKYKNIVITNAGLSLVAAAHSGDTIEFTCIKTGSGTYNGSEVLADMSNLKSVKQIFGITGLTRDATVTRVRSSLSNNDLTVGYSITEIGLYAKDSNTHTEILYAIVVAENGMEDYLPAFADSPQNITLEIYIAATDTDNVSFTASIVPGTYVTVEDFNALNSTLSLMSSNLEGHIGAKNNPHSVTKSQLGLGNVENKSSETIRGELTSSNVTAALGYTPIDSSTKGSANGLAELDENGIVLSSQLPSYVDDVLEYSSNSVFPARGESGKIYIAQDTNLTYRWSGTAYAEISKSLALGTTSSTAYRGDRGNTAYIHSQKTSGNPHSVTKSEVGLGNVDNTSDANKPVSTLQKTAIDLAEKNAKEYADTTVENALNESLELFDKTAIFFGDSITWGALGGNTSTQVTNPYPTVFGNITGCTVINAGVGGATVSTAQTNNFTAQITAQKDNIPNADYAFICFGVNDFSRDFEVGNASTVKSFYADYLAGIKGILVINPNVEIVIILPPRGKGYTNNGNWKNSNGDIFDSYINATIEIATYLNLRIVDFGKVGINMYNVSTYYPSDNNHLTQEGYTLFGEHLAKTYKTGTYESKREFYDRGYRVATNQLGTMPFPNPVDIQGNSYYDGIYWAISGTSTSGITSYKNVQILKGENYHFEFLAYHRDKTNDRTVTYTITMTNIDNASVKYVFKKTLTCIYERLHIDFYANNESGFYKINIVASGDDAYIASPSLSFGGIIPESRKRKVGIVDVTSTNKLVVTRNKFVNGEFIFGIAVTADVSTAHLARVNLNTSNSGDTSPYLPTGNHYFVGMDITDKTPVIMMWTYDNDNPGQYLLHVLGGIIANHVYCANTSLYLGSNNAVHEIIVQEY